jgi:serine/threonine protein kinase
MKLPFQKINDFELKTLIQDNPYSLTVVGYQASLKRNVFIKLLKPRIANHPQWVERFTREAQVCAKLKHPHIVDVYTIGTAEKYTYIAMEFVAGISLKELLEKETNLNPAVSLEIIRQLLLALEYAHKNGVVHRDIKPGNIMLDVHGMVRLTDFGLAHLGEDTSMTQQGSMLGTPAYMAPEQITGEKVTPASDFFAVGATLYEILTGKKPFAGENYSACIQKILNEDPPPVSEISPGISPEIDGLLFRLIEKNPQGRPEKAAEIISAIEAQEVHRNASGLKKEISLMVEKYHRSIEIVPEIVSANESEDGFPIQKSASRKVKKSLASVSAVLLIVLFVFIFWKSGPENSQPKQELAEETFENAIADSLSKTGRNPEIQSRPESENADQGTPDTTTIAKFEKEEKAVPSPPKTPSKKEQTGIPSGNQENAKKEILSVKSMLASNGREENREGTLNIEVEPWAAISLNGETIDSLAHSKKLIIKPGKYQLALTHPSFPPKVFDLNIGKDSTKNIRYSFLENAGYLKLDARPWANVFIDGKFTDTTPLKHTIVLNAGEHLVELRHPEYPSYRQIVWIEPGDTVTIRKNLIQ